ncbi:MAG: WD40 repeat domain-containing protein [Candidatus Fermentibacter sp.]|nr:WD40 repeat domain-containing protein [Candidatus Fermentibacter sp.]
MRRILFSLAALTVLLAPGCGTTGPSFTVDFPFFYLQDVDCGNTPTVCAFMSDGGDGLACAGSDLYFLDHGQGYVLAKVDLGVPLSCCTASSEGGFAAAASGLQFFYVSDETYAEHDPILLDAPASFLLTKPYGTVIYAVCADGSVSTVSTVGTQWSQISNDPTGVGQPSAAAITSDGSVIFVADAADSTIKALDPSGFGTLAEAYVGCPVADMCASPAGGAFAAPSDLPEVWHLDQSTGLHDYTVGLPGTPECIAVTPDAQYIFAGCTGHGIVVVDMQGEIQAQTGSYGQPSDIAVSGDGQRALYCSPDLMKLLMVSR